MLVNSLLYGFAASGALLIGSVIGSFWRAPTRVTGVFLAFASGSLIAALAFELFPEAAQIGGLPLASVGMIVGAGVFVLINNWVDRRATRSLAGARLEQQEVAEKASNRGVGMALVAAVTLDGLPENMALGISLTTEGSLVLLAAIFVSNLPEALVGARAMRDGGRSAFFAIGIWTLTTVLLTFAVVLGSLLGALPPGMLCFLLAFAGGAVLASLADTLMPEAFEKGRPLNAFATVAGFLLSFALAGH